MNTDLVLSPFDNNLIPADEAVQQIADFLSLNVAEGDAAQNTLRAYLGHIQQFVEWCHTAGVTPGQATKQDLVQYRRWLVEQGYERSTIGAKLAALRRFYQAAQEGGYRADNPAAGVRPPRAKTSRRDQILKRYLNRAEIERVLAVPDVATPEGLRDKTILTVFYLQMPRVSEVAKLDVDDIIGNRLHIRAAKGRKDRVVILAEQTRVWLERWLTVRAAHAKPDTRALFISFSKPTYGQRLSINGARFVVNQAEKAAGVYRAGVSCHAWRHAAATHAVSRGASIVAVSEMLGHASIQTTSVYTHVADAEAENPAAYLEQGLEEGNDGE